MDLVTVDLLFMDPEGLQRFLPATLRAEGCGLVCAPFLAQRSRAELRLRAGSAG